MFEGALAALVGSLEGVHLERERGGAREAAATAHTVVAGEGRADLIGAQGGLM